MLFQGERADEGASAAPIDRGGVTFAEPDETVPLSERFKQFAGRISGPASAVYEVGKALFPYTPTGIAVELTGSPDAELARAAERHTRLVDIQFSRDEAREEAYDRRIKAIQAATGIALDNPERGRLSERELRELTREGPADPRGILRQQFDLKLAGLRSAYPDKVDALTFGNIDEEARAIAKGAEDEYQRARSATALHGPAAFLTEAGGALWGMRRDPLFVGSLFAGPTSAVGKEVAARIASAGLFQGLYNAGLTALEQPQVQAWRAEIGVRSGVEPALENVGMAFLFGAIPGAVLRGVHEAFAAPQQAAIRRVLAGAPEAGDIDAAMKTIREVLGPQESAGLRAAEAASEAERITAPPVRDIPEPLHDDLSAAALRQADDPLGSPSPAAVEVLNRAPEQLPPEIAERVASAGPHSPREAQMAASEAIEDIGNRESMARDRAQMEADRLPVPAPRETAPPARSKDPLDKIPLARDDGTPTLVSPKQAARAGEREQFFADLIRECK